MPPKIKRPARYYVTQDTDEIGTWHRVRDRAARLPHKDDGLIESSHATRAEARKAARKYNKRTR